MDNKHVHLIVVAQNLAGEDAVPNSEYHHLCPICGKATYRGMRSICADCREALKEAFDQRLVEDDVLGDQAGIQQPLSDWRLYVQRVRNHLETINQAQYKLKERACAVCGCMFELKKGEICAQCRSIVYVGLATEQLRKLNGR